MVDVPRYPDPAEHLSYLCLSKRDNVCGATYYLHCRLQELYSWVSLGRGVRSSNRIDSVGLGNLTQADGVEVSEI